MNGPMTIAEVRAKIDTAKHAIYPGATIASVLRSHRDAMLAFLALLEQEAAARDRAPAETPDWARAAWALALRAVPPEQISGDMDLKSLFDPKPKTRLTRRRLTK
jgi:hypothetical protein